MAPKRTSRPRRARVPKLPYIRRADGADLRLAGTKAFEILLTVWASCKKLTAKDFCIICGYLAKCNTPG
eukprot:1720393-Pyramimonas_sp.AAC.1